MSMRFFNILVFAIALIFPALSSFAQTFDYAAPSYIAPTGDDLQGELQSKDDSKLCPSANEHPSTSVFSVPLNVDASGDQAENTFVWVVYGGTITAYEGNSLDVAFTTFTTFTAHDANNISRSYSYTIVRGANMAGTHSKITVTWDNEDYADAWVAVQQHSEWNCTDGKWSVFKNIIRNDAPVIDETSVNASYIIGWNNRSGYILPIPTATDDGCPNGATLSYSVVVYDQTSDPEHNTALLNETDGSHQITFDYAHTYDVIWTVSDGVKTDEITYTVTVEPDIQIWNVAWLNPNCGNNNGAIYVSHITDFFENQYYKDNGQTPGGGVVEYSIDNESTWQTSRSFANLAADDYTVKARVKYSDDNILVENQSHAITLTSTDEYSVASLPVSGSADVVIRNASCQKETDGKITINENAITANNSSVSFDGNDYLMLNKSYSGTSLSSFSAALWFRVDKGADANGTLLSFGDDRFFQISLSHYSINDISRIRFQTNTEEGSFIHTTPVNDGRWHLVVVTYNNGAREIYIDGKKETLASTATLSVGTEGITRYGIVGAKSETDDFSAPQPQANYFIGQIAEVAMWDNSVVDESSVIAMMKNGINNASPSDRWVLNDVHNEMTAHNYPDNVFTDYVNTANSEKFARLYGGTKTANISPLLFSWVDDSNNDSEYFPMEDLEDLGVNTYTLSVKDQFGCATQTQNYEVKNSDVAGPELQWNVAIRKPATQSGSTYGDVEAAKANDAFLNTSFTTTAAGTDESSAYWEVDLGGIYQIRTVNIFTGNYFTNFYVLASQNPFDANSTLAADLVQSGVTKIHYTGVMNGANTPIRIVANAQYVRIRLDGAGSFTMNEVEVLSNQPQEPRVIYLAAVDNSCTHTISQYDASITPYAYDGCNGLNKLYYGDDDTKTSLTGQVLTLKDNYFLWTAEDDVPLTDTMNVNYLVKDNIPPVFTTMPFGAQTRSITFCEASNFTLPIPKIRDNYLGCNGTSLKSIKLLAGPWEGEMNETGHFAAGPFEAYIYGVDDGKDISTYAAANDETTPVINQANFLPVGNVVLEWHVVDFSGNETVDRLYLHVQKEPRILLNGISVSPETCNGNDDSRIVFASIDSEKAVDPTLPITYILERTDVDPVERTIQSEDPESSYYKAENPSAFTGIDAGTYKAYIKVNDCESNAYVYDLVLEETEPIVITPTVTPVLCSGQANGAIEIEVAGGSQTNILHFLGEAGATASAAAYDAINLTTTGTIEGWIYLDELVDGGTNWNAGLFGTLNGANKGYGFEMANGKVSFYVGSNSLTANDNIEARKWYYLRGSWDETGMLFEIRNNSSQLYSYTNVPSPAATANTGGQLVLAGKNGDGTNPADNMHGFVRNVRIWKSRLTDAEVVNNLRLLDPIDLAGNLVANIPVDAGGGTSLQNRVPGAAAASVTTTSYAWQKFAYYWINNDNSQFVSREKDIHDQVAANYKITVDDPAGCTLSQDIVLNMNDHEAPMMSFSNNWTAEPVVNLVDNGNIFRYTNEDGGETSCEITTAEAVITKVRIYCKREGSNFVTGFLGGNFGNINNSTDLGSDENDCWDSESNINATVKWAFVGAAGEYTFTWRYANGGNPNGGRPVDVYINNELKKENLNFPKHGNYFNTWYTDVTCTLDLPVGYKEIMIKAKNSNGTANYDWLEITGPDVAAANVGDNYVPGLKTSTIVLGDCNFTPSDEVFNPKVSDGVCPAEDVTLSMEILAPGSALFADGTTAVGLHTLVDKPLTDYTKVRWTATDKAGNQSSFNVNYFIVDNEQPYLENCPEKDGLLGGETCGINNDGNYVVTRFTNVGCNYVVTEDHLIPHYCDNCATGFLTNNINGLSNLNEYVFPVGQHNITWTYTDKTFADLISAGIMPPSSKSITYILDVKDVTPPIVEEKSFTEVVLDETGNKTVLHTDLIDEKASSDNCGINQYVMMKNIAINGTASDSRGDNERPAAAIDGKTANGYESTNCGTRQKYPWWQLDLGDTYDVYRIVIHATSLNRFHVLLSSDSNFGETPTSDQGGFWPTYGFPESVVWKQYENTMMDDPITINIPVSEVRSARYLRIWNGENDCMKISEVEVYGALHSQLDEVTFTCTDINFENSKILVNVIDAGGNITSIERSVTVEDNTPPSVVLLSPTVQIGADGKVDFSAPGVIQTIVDFDASFDACGIKSAEVLTNDVNCGNIGGTSIDVRVFDNNGNYTDRKTTVYVVDQLAPVVEIKDPNPETSEVEKIDLFVGVDGTYTILFEDLIETASDNCTNFDALVYTITPATVTCADISNEDKTVTLTVTDLSNNSITKEVPVVVHDILPPTYVIKNYTLTIPETGEATIYLDDVIDNLSDNCTAREQLRKYINYEGEDADWCSYGYEGGEGVSANLNLASKATSVTGSPAQIINPLSYVNDNKPGGVNISPGQTYYATDAISGTRYVQYNFPAQYVFNSVDVLWAEVNSSDGTIALSHGEYMPVGNITSDGTINNPNNMRDGNTATSATLAAGTKYIQYKFTQPVMVANCRLRWAAGTFTESSTIQYSSDGTTWNSFGTIANTVGATSVLTIDATDDIQYIRLSYNATSAPQLAEFYVYGKACIPVYSRQINTCADASCNGNSDVYLSHVKDAVGFVYLQSATSNGGRNLENLNDEGGVSTYFGSADDNESTGSVEYFFHDKLILKSTQINWYANNSYTIGSMFRRPTKASVYYSTDGIDFIYNGEIGIGSNSVSYDFNLPNTSVKAIRISFNKQRFNVNGGGYYYSPIAISNWIVEGRPCATVTTAMQRVYDKMYHVQTDRNYLPSNDITVTNLNDKDRVADGNNGTQCMYNANDNDNNWRNCTLTYQFSQSMFITDQAITWYRKGDNNNNNNNDTRIRNVRFQYYNNGTWTDWNVDDDITATGITVSFDATSTSNWWWYVFPGISEWDITGYPSDGYEVPVTTYSGCWTTEQYISDYTNPKVTTRYNIELPTTATVKYSTDGGTTWLGPIANAASSTAIGTVGFPASINTFTFGTSVTANALRLEFNNPDAAVGIYEWRTNGHRIAQEGEGELTTACRNFDCDDVHTNANVYFKVIDKSGNGVNGNTRVPIVPYFDILTIDIKDCGYTGERYIPEIINLSSDNTYSYTWKEIDDKDNYDRPQSLFLEWTDDNDDCPYFSPLSELTEYTMPVAGQNWIELNTTGCQYDNNPNPEPYSLPNGNYRINLKVTDNHGCWDDKYYDFIYDEEYSTATSIDSLEACLDEMVTYKINFTQKFSFWQQSKNVFKWDNLSELVSSGLIEVIDGGKSYGDAGTTYGDYYVTVKFKKSTDPITKETTNLKYSYRASGVNLINNEVKSTRLETGTGEPVPRYTLIVLDSLEAGGPYFTDDGGYGRIIPAGAKYVILENGSNIWYGDYDTNCLESRVYRVTVYNVEKPILEAKKGNVDAEDSYVQVTDPFISLDLCPYDVVTYHVQRKSDDGFTAFKWSIDNDATEATGRIIAGGNWNDDYITVEWSKSPLTYNPTVKVTGSNFLGCLSEQAIYTDPIIDDEKPELDCSNLSENAVHNNAPTMYSYTFTDLQAPIITDNCRIAEYHCNIYTDDEFNGDTSWGGHLANGHTNAAGNYPVGTTYVEWTATDYSGNKGTCSHTVTVVDNEPPRFTRTFDNVTYPADPEKCTYTLTSDVLDAKASDNNPDCTVTPTATVTPAGGTGVTLTTLKDYVFQLGETNVTWNAYDCADPRNETAPTSFIVTVVDKEKPKITGTLPDIVVYADNGECSTSIINLLRNKVYESENKDYALDINDEYLKDNCTASANLLVEVVSRNDHKNLNDPFDVGATQITFRVTDKAGNILSNVFQTIDVRDNQAPSFGSADPAFGNITLSYCDRDKLRLPIPIPYDNCGMGSVKEITWTVTGADKDNDGHPDNDYSATGTITRAASAAFDPNGTGYTSILPILDSNEDGSDYIVTWGIVDDAGNVGTEEHTCAVRVQAKPMFTKVMITPMSCGNAHDAKIEISTTEGFRIEDEAVADYTINSWTSSQSKSTFEGLGAGTYTIGMRVNGCYAEEITVQIDPLEDYVLSLSKNDPICEEDETGEVSLTMTGGAAGQLLFNGSSSITAAHYAALNLTNEGSIEAWVYRTKDDGGNATIVSKGSAYALALASGKVKLTVGASSLESSTVLNTEQWYYVVATWNNSGMKLYIDETPNVSNVTASTATGNSTDITVGNGLKGIVRDVRIWNIAKTDGVHPSGKYSGTESNLVAYWTLNTGSGNVELNKCSGGSEVRGLSALWRNSQPQPGSYKWYNITDDENSTTVISSQINLYNKAKGKYKVVFQDPYNCPADGLPAQITLVATDQQPPTIGAMENKTLYVDAGTCAHVVRADEIASLIPTITDGCIFSVKWTVASEKTLTSQVFNYTNYAQLLNEPVQPHAFEGYSLQLGRNRVDVSTSQNGNVTSSAFYYITVEDNIIPVANAKTISGTLSNAYNPAGGPGNGEAIFQAASMNDGSTDNCSSMYNLNYEVSSDGTNFSDEVSFGCDQLGQTPTIYFRVIDESGNVSSTIENSIAVKDESNPVFFVKNLTYSTCATVNAGDGLPAYTLIPEGFLKLAESAYSDNCSVVDVRYSLEYRDKTNLTDGAGYVNGTVAYSSEVGTVKETDAAEGDYRFYEGTTYVHFKIKDSSGNETVECIYVVTVLPKPILNNIE